ncbi:MAG TPA: diacylglycerol kinase family protein [Anaerolineaceae bacterium]
MEPSAASSNAKHLFVVLNPVAGLVVPARTSKRILAWCEQHGWTCEIYETHEEEDLSRVVRKAVARGCSAVAAAGGDGTVSGVASGMLGSPVPLLILPLGTGNLLARDLGVPFDLHRALGLIENGSRQILLDAALVNQRVCVLNAGVGLSSAVIKNTERTAKRRYGFLAYLAVGVRALFGLQPYLFRLTVDGKKLRLRASEIHIAIGGLLGLRVPFEDLRVIPDDGRVDIFVIKGRTARDYLEVLYYILRRRPRQAPRMIYMQAGVEIEITCERVLPFQGDGEVLGETPAQIKVLPNAIPVLLPINPSDAPLVDRIRSFVGV